MNACVQAKQPLPVWVEPADLEQAKRNVVRLGRNMHEHAYLIGKELRWVKETAIKHGDWHRWLSDNVWFSERTAQRFIRFAVICDQNNSLQEYRPGGKNDIMSDLAEAEVIPNPDRLMKLARAYDLLEQWDDNPGPELTKAREFEQEGERLRGEMTELNRVDLSKVNDPGELMRVIDRAWKLENDAAHFKVRAEYELGKILNSIPKENLQGFLALVNLPKIKLDELFAERISGFNW